MSIWDKIDKPEVWRTLLWGGLLGLSAGPREQPYGTLEPVITGLATVWPRVYQQVLQEREAARREQESQMRKEQLEEQKRMNRAREQEIKARTRLLQTQVQQKEQNPFAGQPLQYFYNPYTKQWKVLRRDEITSEIAEDLRQRGYLPQSIFSAMHGMMWREVVGPDGKVYQMPLNFPGAGSFPAPTPMVEAGRDPLTGQLHMIPKWGSTPVLGSQQQSNVAVTPQSNQPQVTPEEIIEAKVSQIKDPKELKQFVKTFDQQSPYAFTYEPNTGVIVSIPKNMALKGQAKLPSTVIKDAADLMWYANIMDKVAQVTPESFTGPIESRVRDIQARWLNNAPAGYVGWRNFVQRLILSLYNFSGKQLAVQEMQKLEPTLPDKNMGDQEFKEAAHATAVAIRLMVANRIDALRNAGVYVPETLIEKLAQASPPEIINQLFKDEKNYMIRQILGLGEAPSQKKMTADDFLKKLGVE